MNTNVTKEQRSISAAEAARRLGVHPATVRRWENEGKITGWRTPGNHRRFLVAEVERFAQEAK